MDATAPLICPNPAGELKNAPEYPVGSWPLDTPSGRFYPKKENGIIAKARQVTYYQRHGCYGAADLS
jgi:hypothetical protein